LSRPLDPHRRPDKNARAGERAGGFTPLDDGRARLPRDEARAALEARFAAKAAGRVRWLGPVLRVTFVTGLVTTIATAAAGYSWLNELRVFEIDEGQLKTLTSTRPADNTLVFDREGKKIGEFFNAYQVHVPFEKLPKDVVDAILAIEDRTFWTHKGYDPKGILRAGVSRLRGSTSEQGASTITQQVVRTFLLPRERTVQRKVQEIAISIALEKRLPKEKILEIYANALFLGNGAYGVGAAAARYFGKTVDQLDTEEAALIAGLFQSPSRYNPTRFPKRARARQLQVLRAMVKSGKLTFERAKELAARPLKYKEYKPLNATIAPYFLDYIREEAQKLLPNAKGSIDGQGLRIYTTLNQRVQRDAEAAVAESAPLLDAAQERTASVKGKDGKMIRSKLETAMLVVDPRQGEVVAMVGGRSYEATKFNRTWQAARSPGSAFKPVIFSLALQNKYKWSDVIYVSPITINNYRPHTPDEDMLTETTLLRAFYRSMNTPTMEVGQKLGLRPIMEQGKKLGVRSPIKEEFGSLLGSSEVNMFDMARLYSTFANDGKLVEQVAITKMTDAEGKIVYEAPKPAARSTQALTPQIAFLMTQGMRAVLAMGTGYTSARLAGVAAGKTGTSNNSTDNWFCGYTPDLVSIVWVGTDEHAQIHGDVTGGKLALPIWDKFMTKVVNAKRPRPFYAPPGVVTTVVHPKFGNRSPNGVRMYFQRGNEPPAEGSALEVLSQSEGAVYRDVFTH
jgi:penicillin-binding protein 1A